MPFTTPKSWATNETATAANMNTHVRDNIAWLATDKPRCQANRAAVQSIPDSTATAIQFSEADTYDVGAMHDTSTNNTRLTVPAVGDGLYLVGGQGGWAASNTGLRAIGINKNGSGVAFERWPTVPSTNTFQVLQWLVPMVATDYLELVFTQTSGGSLQISGCVFWAIWMAT